MPETNGAAVAGWARRYLEQGFPLVPLEPRDKKPALEDWNRTPISSPADLEKWWPADGTEKFGIGIRTGDTLDGRRIVVIDLDVKPELGLDGLESLRDGEEAFGPLPDGPRATTPTGSEHLWFTIPAEVHVPTSAGSLKHFGLPGIDLRAVGGQVAVEPSIHPTGGRYSWDVDHGLGEIPIPELPKRWIEVLSSRRPTEYAPEDREALRERLSSSPDAWKAFQGGATNETAVELLKSAGWHSEKRLRDGSWTLVREGKRSGIGCTVGASGNHGYVYVFTSSTELEDGRGYNPAQLLAALRYDGDEQRADEALAEAGWGAASRGLDVGALFVERFQSSPQTIAYRETLREELEEVSRSRIVTGGAFIFDAPATPPAIWGTGETILHASGEPTVIVGGPGVGKTTIVGQYLRARLGITPTALDMPVAPISGKVLYLASDRPRQIARAFGRIFRGEHRQVLEDGLLVFQGPPLEDLAKNPGFLRDLAKEHGAGEIIIDSYKDVVSNLSEEAGGGALNRSIQIAIADGIEILGLHHTRKAGGGQGVPNKLDDLYGSQWIAAGSGSVILLWGTAGEARVQLRHLKQPAEPLGPLWLEHDHTAGETEVSGHVTEDEISGRRPGKWEQYARQAFVEMEELGIGHITTSSALDYLEKKAESGASEIDLLEDQATNRRNLRKGFAKLENLGVLESFQAENALGGSGNHEYRRCG